MSQERNSQDVAAAIRQAGWTIGICVVIGAWILAASLTEKRDVREFLMAAFFVALVIFSISYLFGATFSGLANRRFRKELEEDRKAQLSGRSRSIDK